MPPLHEDMELGRVAHTPGCCAVLQKDPDTLERWEERTLLKLKSLKSCEHRILHLGRNSPTNRYRMGAYLLGSSSTERDLGVLGEQKVAHEPAMGLCSQEDQWCPRLY